MKAKRAARKGGLRTGFVKEITVRGGEEVIEATFVAEMAVNSGASTFMQTLTSASVPTLLAGSQFSEFFNATASSSLYTMYRVTKVAVRVRPYTVGLQRSIGGWYAVGAANPAGSVGSTTEVANMERSMVYAHPQVSSTAADAKALLGPAWCSKKDYRVEYTLADSESLWSSKTLSGTVPLQYASVYYAGYSSVSTFVGYCDLVVTCQFKGINPA